MKLVVFSLSVFLLSGLVLNFESCKKDTTCIGSVQCLDSSGNAVGSANVMLYALVKSNDGKSFDTADVRANGVTDNDGTIRFTFKYPAIFDIYASKNIGTKLFYGRSVIKLEEGQTVTKSVNMKY